MRCLACGVQRRRCGSTQKNFKTDGIMNHIWTQFSGFSLNLARGNLKKLHCSVCHCQDCECVQPVHPGSKEETRLFSFPSAAMQIMPQCVFRWFYITACWSRACSPPGQSEQPIPSFFERGWFGFCGPEKNLCCVWHQAYEQVCIISEETEQDYWRDGRQCRHNPEWNCGSSHWGTHWKWNPR